MDILLKRYEELLTRLDKSEEWLIKNNYNNWESVKKEDSKVYQLRKKSYNADRIYTKHIA